MTSASFWNYYRDDDANENDDDYTINNSKTTTRKSFECKKKSIESTPADTNRLYAEVVTLKYLSNFWRFIDLPLINWEIEIELDLSLSKNYNIKNIKNTCSEWRYSSRFNIKIWSNILNKKTLIFMSEKSLSINHNTSKKLQFRWYDWSNI